MKKLLILCILQSIAVTSNPVFYSQWGQDEFVYNHLISKKNKGVFVDIGAHNGIEYSNSLFFEKLGWTGICIEPIPDIFRDLRKNRKCICIEGCVYDKADMVTFLQVHSPLVNVEMLSGILENYDPRHLQRVMETLKIHGGHYEKIMVKCFKINELLLAHNIQTVDYMSIDTEGGELEILKSIDFDTFRINVIDVENGYNIAEFEQFMNTKGFRKLLYLGGDEIYVRHSWYIEFCRSNHYEVFPHYNSPQFEKYMNAKGYYDLKYYPFKTYMRKQS